MLPAALCLTAALAGCATPVARSVVAANLAQEQAANQLLLLNIARAHERMPMHFSLIGQIRSAPGGWGLGVPSLGLEIPFGGGADRIYTLTAGNEGQTPVDVTAIASQEFVRGLTTPITAELLAYFINQGWPAALLMHLFFESVSDIGPDGKVVARLHNNPGDAAYAGFLAYVDQVSACDIVTGKVPVDPVHLSTSVDTVSVADGVEVANAKLQLVPATAASEPAKPLYRLARIDENVVLRLQSPAGRGGVCQETALFEAGSKQARPQQAGNLKEFALRSPQSVLYYLGQLSRAQNGGWLKAKGGRPLLTYATADGRNAVLFNMTRNGAVAKPAIEVEYAGHHFAVARDRGDYAEAEQDRSMTTVSLVLLVLGLQDKGADTPAVRNVRLLR